MKKKYNTAKVSNDLIESFVKKNNLISFKILFYISRFDINIPNSSDNMIKLKIHTKDLEDYCNIDKQTLHRYVKKMVNTSICIHKNKEYISYISIIPRAKFVIGTNILELEMFREVLELICQVKRRFTIIDTIQLMKLKSKHSIKMIQILEMINNYDEKIPKRKTYTLNDFNLLFGTNYKRLKSFEVEILKKVKKELDSNSKLSFIYQINYKKKDSRAGRPYAYSVTIDLINNKPQRLLF